jgi:N-methylhydantoinase A
MTGTRIGVDIGGTFTDIVVLRSDGTFHAKKISSTVEDYSRAIMSGLATVLEEIGAGAAEVREIRHGTTVASNAILEHKGARTGLITTEGFRDVLEIRTLRMPRLYDMAWEKPPVLVPRHLRITVNERVDARGQVRHALDAADAERAVRCLLDEGVQAIAVCLLHTYANPTHEQLLKEIIERLAPGLASAISFEVLPEIKEYGAHLDHGDQRLPQADRRPLSQVS